MITVTKLFGMLLMPLGLVWLGLWGAMSWAFNRRMRGLGVYLLLLALGLALVGNPQVGHRLKARLEAGVPLQPEGSEPVEALFVLGGGSEVDAEGRPYLGEYGDRIVEAARLWRAGRAKWLVASGASSSAERGRRDLGAETRQLWLGLGIPGEAIRVIDQPCFVTRDEIQAYRRLQAREGWRRVGLLSSPWHLPRALAMAKREGVTFIPFPSHPRGRIPATQLWHFVPQQEGLQHTQQVCWEILGRWMGR
jgi:uncharacterized SAM-binding protein YcdF (DUF218 family)